MSGSCKFLCCDQFLLERVWHKKEHIKKHKENYENHQYIHSYLKIIECMKVLSSLVRLLLRWVDERNELYEVKVKKKKTQTKTCLNLQLTLLHFHVHSHPTLPKFYCWMWQEKLKKKTMYVSQIIVVTLLEERKTKKIIMKQQQLIYGSCIYQTTYYWWPQARMGVFYCVCKSSFRILKSTLRSCAKMNKSMLMYVS